MAFRSSLIYVQAGAAVLLAATLLIVSAPRLIAQLSLATVTSPAEENLAPEELDSDIDSAVRAIAWQAGDRNAYLRLAKLWLKGFDLQSQAGFREEANQSRDQAQAIMQAGLEAAPGAPDMWFSLAQLEATRGGYNDKVALFLRNSYLTGPREQWVGAQRVEFSVLHWSSLDPSLRGLLQRELRYQPIRSLARLSIGAPPDVVTMIDSEVAVRPDNEQRAFLREAKRVSRGSS